MIKDNFRKTAVEISKKHIFIRKILRKILNIKNYIFFKINTLGLKVDKNTVIFGCFNGRSYCDSPKAIYKYMLTDDRFKEFNFIWVFKDPDKHKYFVLYILQ